MNFKNCKWQMGNGKLCNDLRLSAHDLSLRDMNCPAGMICAWRRMNLRFAYFQLATNNLPLATNNLPLVTCHLPFFHWRSRVDRNANHRGVRMRPEIRTVTRFAHFQFATYFPAAPLFISPRTSRSVRALHISPASS